MENKQTEPAKRLPVLVLEYYESIQILSEKTKAFVLKFHSQFLENRTAHLHNGLVLHINTSSPRNTDDIRIGLGDFGIMGQESSSMSVEILQDRPVDAESYRKFYLAYERLMGRNEAKQLDRPETFLSSFTSAPQTTDEPSGNDASSSKAHPSKTLIGMMSRLNCPYR